MRFFLDLLSSINKFAKKIARFKCLPYFSGPGLIKGLRVGLSLKLLCYTITLHRTDLLIENMGWLKAHSKAVYLSTSMYPALEVEKQTDYTSSRDANVKLCFRWDSP